jgi:hypothetical protein
VIRAEGIPRVIEIRMSDFTSATIEPRWPSQKALYAEQEAKHFSHSEVVMHTASSPSLNRWKTLYQSAILETDKRLLPQRVSEAEEAVKARGHEIFYGDGTPEKEAEALEDALYTLRAYRTAWQHSDPRDSSMWL